MATDEGGLDLRSWWPNLLVYGMWAACGALLLLLAFLLLWPEG